MIDGISLGGKFWKKTETKRDGKKEQVKEEIFRKEKIFFLTIKRNLKFEDDS